MDTQTETTQATEQTAEATANTATETASTDGEKQERQTASVMLHLPIAFKEVLEQHAKEANESLAAFLRQSLATQYNYTLPAMNTRAPRGEFAGMTPEQKKKAISDKQKEQRDTLKAVLAAAKAGKVDLSQILAQFGPSAQGTQAAATATADAASA
jgi:hypothetical protein